MATILEVDYTSAPTADAGNWTPSAGVNIWSATDALQFYVNSDGNRYVTRDIPDVRVGEEHTLTVSIKAASAGWSVTAGNVTEPLATSGDTVVVFTATSGDVSVTLHKQTAAFGDWIDIQHLVVVAEVPGPSSPVYRWDSTSGRAVPQGLYRWDSVTGAWVQLVGRR